MRLSTSTVLLLVVLAQPAFAEDPPLGFPVPAVFPTPDQKYVFVLIPPITDDAKKENADQQTLRQKYSKGSGMYRIEDPNAPLWTVDWYSYEVFPASDAMGLVRVHGDNMLYRHYPSRRLPDEKVAEQLSVPGLSFYRNGKLLKTYSVRELIAKPDELPHMVQRILWMAGGTITNDGKKFVLMTQDSRQIFFSMETGEMLDNRSAGISNDVQIWFIRAVMAVVGFAGLLLVAVYMYQQRDRT